jgi:hypothetical protein
MTARFLVPPDASARAGRAQQHQQMALRPEEEDEHRDRQQAGVALTEMVVGGTRCDAARRAMGDVLIAARGELSITFGWG